MWNEGHRIEKAEVAVFRKEIYQLVQSLFIWLISHASFQFEFRDVFRTREQVSCTFVFSKETGFIFLGPDLFTLKCYNVKQSFKRIWKQAMFHYLDTCSVFLWSSREQLSLIFSRCHAVRSYSSCSIAWRRQWAVLVHWAGDIEQKI